MVRFLLSSGFAAALLAAAPACAQVYKWVDDRGVVNYSNEAPTGRKATQLDPKLSRLSVIGTDEAQRQTGLARANESALSEKIDRLERKLDAERYARSVSDAQMQTVADARYQRCVRDRRVDCDYLGTDPYTYYDDSSYYPYPYYYGTVVYAKPHRHYQRMGDRPGVAPKPVGRAASSNSRSSAPRQM
jgi:hypothetical protein